MRRREFIAVVGGGLSVVVCVGAVRVPVDTINNVVAPDGGAHVCAPEQIGRSKGVIFCVILPDEG